MSDGFRRFIAKRLFSRSWSAALVLVVSAAIGIASGAGGNGLGVQRLLAEWSAAVRSRPASGTLHIVEIDARSIAAIDRWPWPRGEHARAIDAARAAGAETVAFDVDFSARSTPAEDGRLADAIRRADGAVVLATFAQEAAGTDRGYLDSLPVPELREHAALAAVSVRPDRDGHVREAPMGTITDATPRPSLSAMLAHRAGAVGRDFPIDYAIDPATIPRHSFIDLRDGRLPPRALKGAQVLIGATAIELGDRYAVPGHGVVPGVVIQALAAETLMRGEPGRVPWPAALAVALVLAAAVLRARRGWALAAGGAAAVLLLFAGFVLLQALTGLVAAVAPAMLALIAAIAMGGLRAAAWAFHDRRARDAATGLPNRHALSTELIRAPHGTVAVARIVDYDRIAAGLVPEAAAKLVSRVADRVRLVADGGGLHRLSDDLLAWTADIAPERPGEIHATLRSVMLSPIDIDGRRVDVALTLGFAPVGRRSPARAIAQAALAASRAGEDGTGWHVHGADEDAAVARDLSLLGELDDAVRRREIVVVYQPKLDIRADRIASVEALVRWDHPTRGHMRPDLFIPLAERNDRIAGLTLHVVAETIAALKGWAAASHRITAAVNLSAKLLTDTDFNDRLVALLHETGVDPTRLVFEVTESAAMDDPDAAGAALARFRDMGIAISMDDYGTGQSTLSYLKRLPLNEVKIDRSFVQYAHQNRSDAILVRSTIDMAHELGLKVVAEGIEDAACLDFLRGTGCDYAQGYLIGRPMPAAEVAAMLRAEATAAA